MDYIEEIKKAFSMSKFNVVVLNNRIEKDIDISFYSDDITIENAYSNTLEFIELFKLTSISKSFFLLHDHRQLGTVNKKYHVLFYPTIYFLKLWELPSYHKSFYDNSAVVIGDKSGIKSLANLYLKRDKVVFDFDEFHNRTYSQIIINNLLYFYFGNDIYSRETIIDNLLYCLKYHCTEIMIKGQQDLLNNNIWDWNTFTKIFTQKYPQQIKLILLFKSKLESKLDGLTSDEILEFHYLFLRLLSKIESL